MLDWLKEQTRGIEMVLALEQLLEMVLALLLGMELVTSLGTVSVMLLVKKLDW